VVLPAADLACVRSSLVTGRVDLKPPGVGVEASGELASFSWSAPKCVRLWIADRAAGLGDAGRLGLYRRAWCFEWWPAA
jgi:hypothetical protein